MIKAIIIDDERRARRSLKTLLEEHCEGVTVTHSCASVLEAVPLINQAEPDVVFCNVEMPDYSGFELLSFFKEISFELIYVTGHSHHAIRAFEVSAIDYILKPIQIERLQKSVDRLKDELHLKSIHARKEELRMYLDNYSNTTLR